MPLAKLTCPKCHATLKPAKPVPEGKTVRCPKCEETFKAGGEGAEAVTRAKPEAGAKKPAAASKPGDYDEEAEESGGIYGVLKDADLDKKKEEEEERQRRKRKKRRARAEEDEDEDEDEEVDEDDVAGQLLRNLKQRDPRGPAQEIVVRPSNWLLRAGLLGFFGWVIVFIFFMIPVAFPNIDENKKDDKAPPAKTDKDKDKDKKKEKDKGLAELIQEETWTVLLFVFVLLLGLAHGALIAYGAVKMQSMESYNWSLTSCILTIIPLNVVPVWVAAWWVLGIIFDEYAWGFAAILYLLGPLVGGLCLKEFLRPEVKKGFEYKPD